MRPGAGPRRRGLRVGALVAVVSLGAPVVLGSATVAAQDPRPAPPAGAPDGPVAAGPEAQRALEATLALAPADVPPSPDDVFAAVTDAEAGLQAAMVAEVRAAQREREATRAALVAAVELKRVRDREAAARESRDDARATLAAERDLLADLTVRAFVTGGDVSYEEYRSIIHGDTTDPARGRTIMFEQVLSRQEEVTEEARLALVRASKVLAKARAATAVALKESQARSIGASVRGRERADARRARAGAQIDLQQATVRLRSARPGGGVPEGVAIIGLPRLDAEDLAGWFASSPYRPRVSTPISDYAAWFIAEGAAEGIRGDIAFAQAVLETGGFANTDSVLANNFSGIGHCDTCAAGWTFPSPQMGVRAQIQLLKSYAAKKPQYVNPLVDRRLRGPAGCCATWGDLTTVWATDPGYGPKVMIIYTAMVNHALQRRAAGAG